MTQDENIVDTRGGVVYTWEAACFVAGCALLCVTVQALLCDAGETATPPKRLDREKSPDAQMFRSDANTGENYRRAGAKLAPLATFAAALRCTETMHSNVAVHLAQSSAAVPCEKNTVSPSSIAPAQS